MSKSINVEVVFEGLRKDSGIPFETILVNGQIERNPMKIVAALRSDNFTPIFKASLLDWMAETIQEVFEISGAQVLGVMDDATKNMWVSDIKMGMATFKVTIDQEINPEDVVYSIPKLIRKEKESNDQFRAKINSNPWIKSIRIHRSDMTPPIQLSETQAPEWTLYSRAEVSKALPDMFEKSACFRMKQMSLQELAAAVYGTAPDYGTMPKKSGDSMPSKLQKAKGKFGGDEDMDPPPPVKEIKKFKTHMTGEIE